MLEQIINDFLDATQEKMNMAIYNELEKDFCEKLLALLQKEKYIGGTKLC